MGQPTVKMFSSNLDFYYGDFKALHDINLEFAQNQVTALIGPSGCGKSTFLRCLNRMNDLIPISRVEGEIRLDGEDILHAKLDVVQLRRRVGMVFSKSQTLFQKPSTKTWRMDYGLTAYGIKILSLKKVETSLQHAALWDEVKDRLHSSALGLSGGQQQRLCIARALAVEPEVLLMDEPASALDPIATQKIEELIHILKQNFTIIIVTHSMQQAARVSDVTAFFYMGKLIETGETENMFTRPKNKQTEDYITGRFG